MANLPFGLTNWPHPSVSDVRHHVHSIWNSPLIWLLGYLHPYEMIPIHVICINLAWIKERFKSSHRYSPHGSFCHIEQKWELFVNNGSWCMYHPMLVSGYRDVLCFTHHDGLSASSSRHRHMYSDSSPFQSVSWIVIHCTCTSLYYCKLTSKPSQ